MKKFEIKAKTKYEKLPIRPAKYLVISEVDDAGDRVDTGDNARNVQAVELTYYGQGIGKVENYNKKELADLEKNGYLKWEE